MPHRALVILASKGRGCSGVTVRRIGMNEISMDKAFPHPASGGVGSRQSLAGMVERLPNTPAIAVNALGDILSTNGLAQELFSGFASRENLNRMIFLDPAARHSESAWHAQARDAMAGLREQYLRRPTSAAAGLVSELLRSSASFRTMWTAQDWHQGARCARVFHHPEMGPLTVDEVRLASASEPGASLVVYVPRPGSTTDDAFRLLGILRASG